MSARPASRHRVQISGTHFILCTNSDRCDRVPYDGIRNRSVDCPQAPNSREKRLRAQVVPIASTSVHNLNRR